MKQGIWIGTVAAGIGLLTACQGERGASDETLASASEAVVARSVACTLPLPPGTDAGRFVLGANGTLTIGDRAIVSAPIANLGTGSTSIGIDARVGEIYSRPKIAFLDRSVTAGNVYTTTAPTRAAGSQILGLLNTTVNLSNPSIQTINANFPAAPDKDVLLEPGQTASPAPGRFRQFRVKSRATLKLRSGAYYVDTLEVIEPEAKIELDEKDGPVTLWVNSPFAFRGSVTSNLTFPNWLVGVAQPGNIWLESTFKGTLLAHQATLRLATGNTPHAGAFFAKNIQVDPGVVLTHKPSTEITRCTGVVGGVASDDIDPVPGEVWDPQQDQIPADFLDGVDQCVNKKAQQDGSAPDAEGNYNFTLVDQPSCPQQIEFCDANDKKLVPQPTLQQFLDKEPAGSVCPAIAPIDRCLCPVHPASLGAACSTSAECAPGFVCAQVCEGPDCAVPRRCGQYIEGCDGAPRETNCEEIRVCPDPESVGTVTESELRAGIVPPTTTVPGGTPSPAQPNTEHFDSFALLKAGLEGGPASCIFEPVEQALPVVDDSQSQETQKGRSNWGVFVSPHLHQKNTSRSLEPFGVVLPSFSAEAGLDIVGRVFGIDINVFKASAAAVVNACKAEAGMDIQVGPFADAAESDDRATLTPQIEGCEDAQEFLKRATTLLNWAQAQVLAVIDEYEANGPNQLICERMNTEFDLSLDCTGNPEAAAIQIVDVLRQQYLSLAQDTIARAQAYATSLAGIGVANQEYTFFDETLKLMGAEADFPIGPLVLTVGGAVEAHLKVVGTPNFVLTTTPGGTAKIGASFTVTPSADVDARALVAIGFKVIAVGVEGRVNLVGIDLPVTAEVYVQGQPVVDPRDPSVDGYSYASLDSQPQYALLKSKKYSWDTYFRMYGNVQFDDFLDGQIDGFVRIKLLFFKKTWRKRLLKWDGIKSPISDIPLFNYQAELPFSTPVPEFLSAPRFPYVNPPAGNAITFGTPPTEEPEPCTGFCPGPTAPVITTNLEGLVEDKTVVLCNPVDPPA